MASGRQRLKRSTLETGYGAVFYGILAVMGLIPQLGTTFGMIPVSGHDVWLHALTAIAAAYFGWMAPVDGGEPTGAARV